MRIELKDVRYRYSKEQPWVLDGVDLVVDSSETLALMGPSGSGKTTLLSLLGLLQRPGTGSIVVDGQDAPRSRRRRAEWRAETFAWVFQSANALGRRTALDNVALGALATGARRHQANQAAERALASVGLTERADFEACLLSGGELQRVSIARALVLRPQFILADEPTGQLDHATSELVLDMLWNGLGNRTGAVIATHDPSVASRCDRIAHLFDGRLVLE